MAAMTSRENFVISHMVYYYYTNYVLLHTCFQIDEQTAYISQSFDLTALHAQLKNIR
jgi:hypothetical protein